MCGLTGFYAINSDRSRSDLDHIVRDMTDKLVHRGPDFGDVWQDPDVPLALGHRRLSILDLSEHGAQPMISDSGRYVIVYNGEIYNHLALRNSHLPDHTFHGHSDTETILALIEKLGFEKTLEAINGMFVFALWDRKSRNLHFARDRHGKKPLYIGWAKSALVFGSELKSLCAHPDFDASINKHALALYTHYNCVPTPQTIYQNVWQLKPGHFLSLSLEGLEANSDLETSMRAYWSHDAAMAAAKEHEWDLPDSDLIETFESLLTQCVEERLISDVPLGAFLSGGIDSSTVVALMQRVSDAPVHTYTIGFDEAGYNEADHARAIAKHLGTDHHEHICSAQDALDVIEMLPDMYDEPFADQSAIPTYLVAQFARKDVTVALSGDGGDEMLGGYSRHFTAPRIAGLPAFLGGVIEAIPASLLKTIFPHKPLLAKHLQKTAGVLSAESRADIYDAVLSNWEAAPVLADHNAALNLSEDPKLSLSEQLMLWDTQHYLPNDILTKVDRASMAVSLEARAPLLDRRIFDFVWRLHEDTKIRGGKGKWLLREVLARHVPRDYFERPKQGFNIPIASWLRGTLRDWAEDLLDKNSLNAQGLFDSAAIHSVWDAHLKGEGHHDEALWNILMFQAWYKRWMT